MKTLRAASFWLVVLVLPGGLLLLTPRVLGAIRRLGRQRRIKAAR